MATFLSTYSMKVDKKGRVSVPAPFRAALSQDSFAGIVAYASPVGPAVDARGRVEFDMLLGQLRAHAVQSMGPDLALLGGAQPSADQVLAAAAFELPFDGEGRVVLPETFLVHAGIGEQVSFVGRGSFFQLWSPDNFTARQEEDLRQVRARLSGAGGRGQP